MEWFFRSFSHLSGYFLLTYKVQTHCETHWHTDTHTFWNVPITTPWWVLFVLYWIETFPSISIRPTYPALTRETPEIETSPLWHVWQMHNTERWRCHNGDGGTGCVQRTIRQPRTIARIDRRGNKRAVDAGWRILLDSDCSWISSSSFERAISKAVFFSQNVGLTFFWV